MAAPDTYFGWKILEERMSPVLCFEICDPAFQHRKVFCCVHHKLGCFKAVSQTACRDVPLFCVPETVIDAVSFLCYLGQRSQAAPISAQM